MIATQRRAPFIPFIEGPIYIDPVEHSVTGLAGSIHKHYRSEITAKQDLGGGWRRIYGQFVDCENRPLGGPRRPTLPYSVIVPNLPSFEAYRLEMWYRIEHGGNLIDITA